LTVHHLNENKVYQKVLEQKTGVGSIDKLQARRNKLLEMYSSGPTPGELSAQPSSGTSSKMPAEPPKRPVMPSAVPTAPEPVAAVVAAEPSAVATAKPAAMSLNIMEANKPVPDEFKSIVRRANKMLLDRADDPPKHLVNAFNKFIARLNDGAKGDDLVEAGDELEDVYHDCR
jgi:hypothetical protein